MKVLRGFMPALNKFVVACGFVLLAEQEEEAHLRAIGAFVSAQNILLYLTHSQHKGSSGIFR